MKNSLTSIISNKTHNLQIRTTLNSETPLGAPRQTILWHTTQTATVAHTNTLFACTRPLALTHEQIRDLSRRERCAWQIVGLGVVALSLSGAGAPLELAPESVLTLIVLPPALRSIANRFTSVICRILCKLGNLFPIENPGLFYARILNGAIDAAYAECLWRRRRHIAFFSDEAIQANDRATAIAGFLRSSSQPDQSEMWANIAELTGENLRMYRIACCQLATWHELHLTRIYASQSPQTFLLEQMLLADVVTTTQSLLASYFAGVPIPRLANAVPKVLNSFDEYTPRDIELSLAYCRDLLENAPGFETVFYDELTALVKTTNSVDLVLEKYRPLAPYRRPRHNENSLN